ncbi:MAG TPA: PqqD family peptide modification chaperone [Gemmatimonadaceae bacterium]|nr:PqqD family peptide modification chaperone [Gemmatimonadaceae bacterium]
MSARTVIGPATVVSRSEEPVAIEVDGTVVMMSIDQGMYFGLEGVGPRIWALLDRPRRVDDVCTALTEEFDIDADSCRREVIGFLDELRDAHLIRIHGDADGTAASPDGA